MRSQLIFTGKRWINLNNVTEIEDRGDELVISFTVAWPDPLDATKTIRDGRTITDIDEVNRLREILASSS